MAYFRCLTEGGQVSGEMFDSYDYVYNNLSGSNDHPRVIWTYTNSTGYAQTLYMKGRGLTNTGGNEGFFELDVDNVQKEIKPLNTDSTTSFEFTPIEVPAGSTVKIKCDWVNSHTNCNRTIWAAAVLTHELGGNRM